MCLSLHRLNLQLQSAFRLRDNVISLKGEGEALMGADKDLDRVHRAHRPTPRILRIMQAGYGSVGHFVAPRLSH